MNELQTAPRFGDQRPIDSLPYQLTDRFSKRHVTTGGIHLRRLQRIIV